MPQFRTVLSSLGFYRKDDAPPVINSKPSVIVRYAGGFGSPYSIGWARDFQTLATTGYQHNSDVYACISLIAQAGKAVKWDTAPGSKSVASVDVLTRSGGPSLIEGWLSYLLLSGNDFMQIQRVERGVRPYEVYLLSPAAVKAIPDRTAPRAGVIQSWEIRNGLGVPRPYPANEVLQSKLFNPLDPIYGMAPMEACYARVQAENEGAILMQQLLAAGASPGWIEARENSLWDDKQVAQLKQRLADSKRRGDPLFLENAIWHEMGFRPGDTGVAEQHVLSKRDIASVFHVPAQLIGDSTTQTYSNNREARQALYTEAVIPLLSQFRDDWNRVIGKELNSPLAFDKDVFDAIAQARSEASDRVTKVFTSGLITQDEGRRELSYDPVKSGDVFYAPANLLPLGEGSSSAAAAPAPKEQTPAEKAIGASLEVAARWSGVAIAPLQLAIEAAAPRELSQ